MFSTNIMSLSFQAALALFSLVRRCTSGYLGSASAPASASVGASLPGHPAGLPDPRRGQDLYHAERGTTLLPGTAGPTSQCDFNNREHISVFISDLAFFTNFDLYASRFSWLRPIIRVSLRLHFPVLK